MDTSKYEIFARCLRAAAAAPCLEKDGLVYLVYEEQNDLIEQLLDGPRLVDQDIITSEVKEGAAAAYLYLDEKCRFAFCADKSDTLKYYTYVDEWDEGSLGTMAEQKLFPGSKLQACVVPEGLEVYFQDSSGNIRGLAHTDNNWRDLGVVPGKPRTGSPLSIAFSQSEAVLYLYYVGEDESLRLVRISYPERQFEEAAVPGSGFDHTIEAFNAFRGETDGETIIYVLAGDTVIQLNGAGEKTVIGEMDGRTFTPAQSDQFCDTLQQQLLQQQLINQVNNSRRYFSQRYNYSDSRRYNHSDSRRYEDSRTYNYSPTYNIRRNRGCCVQ